MKKKGRITRMVNVCRKNIRKSYGKNKMYGRYMYFDDVDYGFLGGFTAGTREDIKEMDFFELTFLIRRTFNDVIPKGMFKCFTMIESEVSEVEQLGYSLLEGLIDEQLNKIP